ncbi:hypothetical protein [Streptomyces sp. NPDC058644]|uniref:hypothetical protein n=1 Tax=unclassified Streptomyces TaxID=2593676 RepID=UPI00365B3578
MRAYRKTTQRPVCLYLYDREAAALAEELVTAIPMEDWSQWPSLTRLLDNLQRYGRTEDDYPNAGV